MRKKSFTNNHLLTRKIAFLFIIYALWLSPVFSKQDQEVYYPGEKEWQKKTPKDVGINAFKLKKAVEFAKANEYSGTVDLRIAILDAFQHEPYIHVVGPTKKRGGPTGMILKNGYIIAQWGDIKRVDMTFSVTKSYSSTVARLAVDAGLIHDGKMLQLIMDALN